LVVPKSIPIILLMIVVLVFSTKVKEYATMDFVTGCQSIFFFNIVITSTRLVINNNSTLKFSLQDFDQRKVRLQKPYSAKEILFLIKQLSCPLQKKAIKELPHTPLFK